MEAHRLLSGPGGRNPTLAAVTGGKAHPEMASPGRQPFAEPGQGERVAVLDRAVAGVEQFEIDTVVWHPGRAQRPPEGDGAEVEAELVPGSGVDPNRPQRAQRLGVARLRGLWTGSQASQRCQISGSM